MDLHRSSTISSHHHHYHHHYYRRHHHNNNHFPRHHHHAHAAHHKHHRHQHAHHNAPHHAHHISIFMPINRPTIIPIIIMPMLIITGITATITKNKPGIWGMLPIESVAIVNLYEHFTRSQLLSQQVSSQVTCILHKPQLHSKIKNTQKKHINNKPSKKWKRK